MELSQEQRKKFDKWLEFNWKGDKKCPICLSREWNISDRIFELREFTGEETPREVMVQPIVIMSCKRCGFNVFFNAIGAGLLPPKNQKNAREKEEKNK